MDPYYIYPVSIPGGNFYFKRNVSFYTNLRSTKTNKQRNKSQNSLLKNENLQALAVVS